MKKTTQSAYVAERARKLSIADEAERQRRHRVMWQALKEAFPDRDPLTIRFEEIQHLLDYARTRKGTR